MFRYRDIPISSSGGNRPGHCQLLYRPEDLDLADGEGPGRLQCRLAEATPIAGRTMVTGLHDYGLRLTIVTDRPTGGEPGSPLWVQLPDTPAAVFDNKGGRIR